ncbi:sensor histidine kinase [Hymenobacter cavernae]|uniref:histidine kinase n=1 Tax=Hymenobacter cavernae TaxID=2044852 RepID=A0ABQ1TYM1_9BACT|nr:ATP-binding protein [Hymenobacter cavernae]GGF05219.1 PAS domain-containing sensor histidine kinase [Hymenobacter cavernae]
MSLKTKIRLSILTMLGLLLGLGGYAFFTIQRLEGGARAMQQRNFFSVEYGQQMLLALEQMETQPTITAPLEQFRRALTREATNITEPGELELVDSLTQTLADYQRLLDDRAPLAQRLSMLHQLRAKTHRVVSLNTKSFNAETQRATISAAQARRSVLVFLGLSALLGTTLVVRLPRILVRPLRRLTAQVEDVAGPGPATRVAVSQHDEVGSMAEAVNRVLVQAQDDRRATRAELITERNRMESIVQSLDEGLLLVDQNRNIRLANKVACELLSQSAEQLVGHSAEEVAKENELLGRVLAPLDLPPQADPAKLSPVFTLFYNGEEAYYRLTVHPIVSFNEAVEKTEFVGHILSLRNISEFKKLDQVKSNFLATVSHELKTPLASINLSLMLLQDERTDVAERQRIASGIRDETQRLLGMVSQLLDVARLDAGAGIKLNVQTVALADVVRYATETVRPQLEDKELGLEIQISPSLPTVHADLEKTTWVLINLLSNAIRYSPHREALVIKAVQWGDMVRLSVQDRGPGISSQYHKRIFQRFAQVPNPGGQRGGSGLGLSLSREFITAQGGQLWVESAPERGSMFLFTLPLAVQETLAEVVDQSELEQSAE